MADGIASPPREVWEYQTSDSTAWLCLFGLATFGSYDRSHSPRLYPAKATLADRLGIVDASGKPKVTTIKHPLSRLVRDKVIVSAKPKRGWYVQLTHRPWDGDERPPAAPPGWLLAMDLPSHLKRCLIGVRSFSDFNDDRDDVVVRCTVSEVAARTGQKWKTAYTQFAALEDLGFLVRDNDAIVVRRVPVHGTVPPDSTAIVRDGDSGSTTADSDERGSEVPLDGEQTLLGSCSDLAKTLPANGAQASLFGDEPSVGPANPARPTKRDLAAEVLAAFNAEVAALRAWAGKSKAPPCTMTKARRKEITDRLAEIEGTDDDRLAACRRVFDVQAHQVRANGKTPKDGERAKKDWASLNTTTLFRAANFTRWLDRWSPDGDHVLWFQPKRRHDANYGAADRHGTEAEDIALYHKRIADFKTKLDNIALTEEAAEF